MERYLKEIGAAGEVKRQLQEWSDLPGRAESEVALHSLDRRGLPSSKEGRHGLSKILPIHSHLL